MAGIATGGLSEEVGVIQSADIVHDIPTLVDRDIPGDPVIAPAGVRFAYFGQGVRD